MRRLNFKLLILLVVAVAAVGAGVHLLHEVQSRRSAARLLDQAISAQEDGLLPRSAAIFARYLRYRPGDAEALARYGLLLADLAAREEQAQRAWLVLQRAIALGGSRDEARRDAVRRRFLELGVELGRTAEVREVAATMLGEDPRDGKALLALGRCDEADGRLAEAAARYGEAIEADPTLVDAYVFRANLQRTELQDPAGAGRTLDAMVAANDGSYLAHFARAAEWALEATPEAREHAEREASRAVELAPDEPRVRLFAAGLAIERSDWDAARGHLRHGLENDPGDGRFYQALALVEVRAGDLEEAAAVLDKALKVLPDSGDLKWLRGHVVLSQLDAEEGGGLDEEPRSEKLAIAAGIIQDLGRRGYDRGRLGLLDGRLQMVERRWSRAAEVLEEAAPLLVRQPELAREADLLLARTYGQLGDEARQFAAYRRLAGRADDVEGRARAAASLESLGRFDEALTQYRLAAEASPEARLAIARLTVDQVRRQPPARRVWESAEAAIDEAEAVAPDSPLIPLLRADVLEGRGRPDEARALLARARDARPGEYPLWAGLIALAYRDRDLQAVPGLLDAAEQALGDRDRASLRVLRARYLATLGGPGAAEAVAALAEGLDGLAKADVRAVRLGIADSLAFLGDHRRALGTWAPQADAAPSDVAAQLLMFELALRAGDEEAQGRALARVERLDPTLARFAAVQRTLDRGRRGEAGEADLAEAGTLLDRVAAERPESARVDVSRAELARLRGEPDSVVSDHYGQAFLKGERSPAIIRQYVELLGRQGRHDDAAEVLAQLRDQPLLAQELNRVELAASFQNEDYSHALELAERAVKDGSSDFRDYLWLARLRALVDPRADVEAPLRRAIELAGADPTPRVSLVQFLVARGRRAEAERAGAEAEAAITSDADLPTLAQCHLQLGRVDKALEIYGRAVAAAPDDPATLRGYAAFLLGLGRHRAAEPVLEKLDALGGRPPREVASDRLVLAMVLATNADEPRARRALELLGLGDDPSGDAAGDLETLRVRARVLAAQPDDRHRARAVALLEALRRRRAANPADDALLAGLYEARDEWPESEAIRLALIDAAPAEPGPLAEYVQSLLRRRPDQAGPWLEKLAAIEPDAARTHQLRARLLELQGRPAEAAEVLRAFALAHEAVLEPFAAELERMGQDDAADQLYRRLADPARRDPVAALKLAEFLGRRGRTREALDLCESARRAAPPAAFATALANILSAGGDPDQARRAEGWLRALAAEHPDELPIPMGLAIVLGAQARYAEVQAIYRNILAREPGNVVALNNLAWSLALHAERDAEAIDLINRAIRSHGALPALLDTRATIHLKFGRADRAVADLRAAIANGAGDPAIHFHLAQALARVNDLGAARKALDDARRLGLRPTALDRLERPAYERLVADLAR